MIFFFCLKIEHTNTINLMELISKLYLLTLLVISYFFNIEKYFYNLIMKFFLWWAPWILFYIMSQNYESYIGKNLVEIYLRN